MISCGGSSKRAAAFRATIGGEEATIFVILDGENAWEHYDRQGPPFLRALYRRLGHASRAENRDHGGGMRARPRDRCPSIFPGSWINSDFYIWIGHADDHRAWRQLAEARRALDTPAPGLPKDALAQAQEEMLIAEGSDWFWWYGDDHSSSHDLEFDELFRRHVRNVYRALDKPIPEELFVTNITTQPAGVEIHRPTGFIAPDARRRGDQLLRVGRRRVRGCGADTAGAMHQVADAAGRRRR